MFSDGPMSSPQIVFEVGDLDGWQIIPFYGGIARSGKSQALTSVFKQFYEAEDVRTLSNNVERKFGLASIYDGFMFISPECRETMALEQAEFQSMVSGEDVSIAVKHEKAKSIQWTTPGVMAGNGDARMARHRRFDSSPFGHVQLRSTSEGRRRDASSKTQM